MSKRNAHTDFLPVVGAGYANAYCYGVITEVSPRITATNGKEYFKFSVLVQAVTDTEAESVAREGIAKGVTIHRMATPTHKANGQFNVMKNYERPKSSK